MSVEACRGCGRWLFGVVDHQRHQCPPEWEARIPDYHGDDWTTVKGAMDAEDAAEKLAQSCDDENRLVENGAGRLVEVRKPGDEAVQRFRVTAEAEINYTANAET